MSFQIRALDRADFAPLFDLDDASLHARSARRMRVESPGVTPCRVGLVDAEVGEEVLLLPFAHHSVDVPYRSSGPIYVRRTSTTATPLPGELPAQLRGRLLSLRAYRADGWMLGGEVVEGTVAEPVVATLLARPGVAYLHAHFARTGCYGCRIDPA